MQLHVVWGGKGVLAGWRAERRHHWRIMGGSTQCGQAVALVRLNCSTPPRQAFGMPALPGSRQVAPAKGIQQAFPCLRSAGTSRASGQHGWWPLHELFEALQKCYCGTLSVEFDHALQQVPACTDLPACTPGRTK